MKGIKFWSIQGGLEILEMPVGTRCDFGRKSQEASARGWVCLGFASKESDGWGGPLGRGPFWWAAKETKGTNQGGTCLAAPPALVHPRRVPGWARSDDLSRTGTQRGGTGVPCPRAALPL